MHYGGLFKQQLLFRWFLHISRGAARHSESLPRLLLQQSDPDHDISTDHHNYDDFHDHHYGGCELL